MRSSDRKRSMKTQVEHSWEYTGAPVVTMRRLVSRAGKTGWHSHHRSQLLYATEGLMVVSTDDCAWMVPNGFAMFIAPGIRHDAACEGPLHLCTAYIDKDAVRDDPSAPACRMIRVSPLLDAALRALAEDHDAATYEPDGRTGLLTRVVISEIERAEDVQFVLPMPQDVRLRRMCAQLMEEPALAADIDEWAETVGLSRRTLTRRFREETSLSFGEWRRRLRVARATMQASGGVPIHRVVDVVGYKTVHGLRAMMKRCAAGERQAE